MQNESQTLSEQLDRYQKEIIDFCRQHRRIYLYGTGKVAQLMMDYLLQLNLVVAGFIVSDKEKAQGTFAGKTVYAILDAPIEPAQDGIVLAVSEQKQSEVRAIIVERWSQVHVYAQKLFFRVYKSPQLQTMGTNQPFISNGYFASFYQLEQLGEQFKTDKNSYGHNYLTKYEFFLKNLQGKKFTLLELGVFTGASLKTWGAYFPAARVVGVDINVECGQYQGDNREVIIADLSQEKNIIALRELHPTVIVDDASHIWSHQIKALFLLFSVLPHGGIYILEDIETSFPAAGFQGFDDAVISAYDVCSQITEVATSQFSLRKQGLFSKEIENIGMQIEIVSFIHGSCILVKK